MLKNNTYRVALFGHRDFDGHRMLDTRLYEILFEMIGAKPFVEIYIGRNGEFDIYAASVIKRLQRAVGKINNEFNLVLPYAVKDMDDYARYYDNVIIPEGLFGCHPKEAIKKRNQWMVEEADILIFYVERERGGAYEALRYAKKLKKQIINLAKEEKAESL